VKRGSALSGKPSETMYRFSRRFVTPPLTPPRVAAPRNRRALGEKARRCAQ
jgi:hypothetical protein